MKPSAKGAKGAKRAASVEEEQEFRSGELTIKVARWGPDEAAIRAASERALQHPAVLQHLKDNRHRLISFEVLDPDPVAKAEPTPPDRYRATIYDYTDARTVLVEGLLSALDNVEVSDSAIQPIPSDEEFAAAIEALLNDSTFGQALREQRLRPYRPMPPLLGEELPDGHVQRIIGVGLLPATAQSAHEIVGVDLLHGAVIRYDGKAPARARAGNSTCGLPPAGQPTAPRGAPGQVSVSVYQGATLLWSFVAVRPAASSGANGSGVELRYVNYRGKRVLYRAHVPILNVLYNNNACGPYRDWQWQEGMLQANGTDITSGFRYCPAPAQTILDNGTDTGDYLGVAIYVQGLEVVLVSEMQAGWYRYISEWRLHANGTILPRFGFSTVQSSCVCNVHHHHTFWRFDFDIRTPGNNVVREYNDPPIFPNTNWHTKYFEIKRPRDPARQRKWRIEHAETGEGYELIPGANDGVADAYAKGDVWVLRYRGTELDDAPAPADTSADLDRFLNGESVYRQDVVVWYGAHFTHDISHNMGEIVGPQLVPVNW